MYHQQNIKAFKAIYAPHSPDEFNHLPIEWKQQLVSPFVELCERNGWEPLGSRNSTWRLIVSASDDYYSLIIRVDRIDGEGIGMKLQIPRTIANEQKGLIARGYAYWFGFREPGIKFQETVNKLLKDHESLKFVGLAMLHQLNYLDRPFQRDFNSRKFTIPPT